MDCIGVTKIVKTSLFASRVAQSTLREATTVTTLSCAYCAGLILTVPLRSVRFSNH
jgi:hypothetical protein